MNFIFDPGLVLYLPLYESDGSSFMSRDACGYTCMPTGASWRPNGYYFDGTDDVITLSAMQLDFTNGAFTIQAWCYLDSISSPQSHIIARGLLQTDGWEFMVESGGYLELNTNQSGTNQQSYSGAGEITTGSWLFLEAVRDGTSVRLYKNGTDITLAASSHTDPATSSRTVKIGMADNSTKYFNGRIGDIWVYSRALAPQERHNIYMATKWRYQ